MIEMRGKGSQKEARLERLKEEIIEYIAGVPDCSAADIVHYLSSERRTVSYTHLTLPTKRIV